MKLGYLKNSLLLKSSEKVFENTIFIDKGQGAPIILLHGLFGALSNFDALKELLMKNNYRVIIPKLPLYNSELKETDLDGLIHFLNRFFSFLKLENINVSLIGNSLGGHLALMLVLQNKFKISSIVLTASSGLFENGLGSSYPKRDRETLREKIGETFGSDKFVTEELVDEVEAIVTDKSKVIRVIKLAKSATRNNLNEVLYQIQIPTLLIWGDKDTITPLFVAKQFNEKINNSILEIIPNVGHAPMMEEPMLFNTKVLNFFKSIHF